MSAYCTDNCLFFLYFEISSLFHFYHLNNRFITINNRNKNFSNLNLHLNFRDCIFELILLYQFSGVELNDQANERLDE